MQPSLYDLESLAREAGEILRSGINQNKHVSYKGVIDLVTEYDHRSEEFLLSEINRRFPGHRILAEESGGNDGKPYYVWYIDPLDGTVNFAHGIPIFSVSIAYAENGQVKIGVVYAPMQDECFSAELGGGAWLNGQPIYAAQAEDLDHSLLVTGFRYDIRTNPQNNLAEYARFALLSQGVRRLGSAALDLCYVAAGRFDGYWELHVQPWDVAAGGLIAQEAGAIVTDRHGGPDYLTPPCTILAANLRIHSLMFDILEQGNP